ncbi:hypothetical protein LOK49_LG03G01476 [Camellia lanceoleosa]|uniref:Uncharacterized protein n=1 Tax=Camellia lanceoleosa TaxID=1840588 RepID=A0ACC0IEA2_9ERIC|nr:hypothetical protein LOK49_LG03G01476 [Camellia lanceoleosa]
MQSGGEVKNGVRCQCSDDSLRKMVLKQGLLPKESAFRGGLGLAFDQTETEFASGNQKFNQPFKDLISEPQGPLIYETRDLIFVNNPYWANTLDYEFKDSQFQRSENLGINSLPVSHSHPLNPRDGNLCVKTNSFRQRLTNRPGLISSNRSPNGVGGLNMDLIPCSAINWLQAPTQPSLRMVRGVGWFHNGIRNHRFAANDMRNQRTCSTTFRTIGLGSPRWGVIGMLDWKEGLGLENSTLGLGLVHTSQNKARL